VFFVYLKDVHVAIKEQMVVIESPFLFQAFSQPHLACDHRERPRTQLDLTRFARLRDVAEDSAHARRT